MFNNPWYFERLSSQINDTEEQGEQHILNLNSPTNHSLYQDPPQQTLMQKTWNVGSTSAARDSTRKRHNDLDEKSGG